MNRFTSIVIFLAAMTCAATGDVINASNPGLIVHEWGTFTSIAGEDGRAVQWLPQGGPVDLPCFVERISSDVKWRLSGTVRMETPVLYFYAPREMTVDVNVRFRQGVLTEWYPRPAVTSTSGNTAAVRKAALEGTIAWRNVTVMPGAGENFPVERESNHYYLARQTDASPLQSGSEKEKFLFYRGVGRLPPPISAVVGEDGEIVVRNPRGDALGDLMLFENRGGNIRYHVRHAGGAGPVTLDPSTFDDKVASPQAELQRMLVAHGLYPREAKAMVESWRDLWFEQGTRLFYLVSGQTVDAILPLEIAPAPAEVARVFVGRMELMTPATLREVREAIAKPDWVTLARYGRFLEPIGKRVLASSSASERARFDERLQAVSSSWARPAAACSEKPQSFQHSRQPLSTRRVMPLPRFD
jgi:hypothetical protein